MNGGIIDLRRYTWTRFSNMDMTSMWQRPFPLELFMGRRGAARVAAFSDSFVPASSNSADANGTAILPIVETGFLGYDGTQKTWRMAFIEYDVRDPGSSNPYLTLSYIDSPEETSYTALTPTLTETTELTREHIPLNFPARGIAFKLAQTAASSDTRVYGVEVHAQAREGNR